MSSLTDYTPTALTLSAPLQMSATTVSRLQLHSHFPRARSLTLRFTTEHLDHRRNRRQGLQRRFLRFRDGQGDEFERSEGGAQGASGAAISLSERADLGVRLQEEAKGNTGGSVADQASGAVKAAGDKIDETAQ